MSEEEKSKNKRASGNKAISSIAMPQRTIEDAIQIAELIYKNFAGQETPLGTIAKIVGIGEKSTNMTYLIKAGESYGIIDKTAKDKFTLSELGRKIVAPTYEGEREEAIRKAILTPTLMSKIYSDYDKHPIPESAYFINSLEQKYEIPKGKSADIKDILIKNADFASFLSKSADGGTTLLNLSNSIPQSSNKLEIVNFDKSTIDAEEVIEYTPHFSESTSVDFNKVCFIITPIGSDDSEERKHANMMLNHLIKPVCDDLGLNVVRADKIDKSGLITHQILEHIAKSAYCVADLSFNNPNVFYELGVRHVCQLPTVQIIRKGDKIPFDVSQGRTITIDTSDIYTIMDRFESARKELKEHIQKISNNIKNDIADDNPIKVYLPDLKVILPKRK
ncbi:hypothetical protein [Cyclobacterium sp.]|uniref:hypothetical protein n=1 Tax=Cyclobacterium sp. TaxID=1966343 RepID=UPI0019BDE831|nr:hypothetical protein [Cyclobacterium sp.]MBD3630040.1 hypothetical protein [Cyclobacterium sp.]